MSGSFRVLMVAAENDALPGGKVGGIGDVVRDVAPALAAQGCRVDVVTPAYGALASAPEARALGTVSPKFGAGRRPVRFLEAPGRRPRADVRHVVVDHPLFAACGAGRIYCDDPPETPFATDASKFALFCAAVVEGLLQGVLARPDVMHLHDWHAALVLALRRFDPEYASLLDVRAVYTVHNLALQGIRPFAGHPSSLQRWFPALAFERAPLADPRWPECVNPMAVGIRMADAVHTVSPSYAREILEPSEVRGRGYRGGEGLESDLRDADAGGRLLGILNGCEYPDGRAAPAPSWQQVVEAARREVLAWAAAQPALSPAHYIAGQRLDAWSARAPDVLLTSVSRVTAQKVRLLAEPDLDGRPALEGVLDALGERGAYVFLGTGDAGLERFLAGVSARHPGFVFLRGYSDALSAALYAAGDLFLMPSSFEPCGISQMLAMRAGQPCLVHHVGGLRDTVQDGVNGFAFTGTGIGRQASALVEAARSALALRRGEPERWQRVRAAAAAARFPWEDTARAYLEQLYRRPSAAAPTKRESPRRRASARARRRPLT